MLPPEYDSGAALSGCDGGLFRTFPVLVIIRINAKAPESGDSGALRGKSHNQMEIGSGLKDFGSPQNSHRRILVSLQFVPVVQLGNRRSPSSAPPKAVPKESPAERAVRFRELLNSERYRSQSELAKALGCSQPWISKALRLLRESA